MLPPLPNPFPPVPLTTVLFDLDDTLFDHVGTARAALVATAAAHPRLQAADPEALYQHYSELLEEIHAQLLAGRYTYEEARQLRFERLLGPYGVGVVEAGAIAQAHYGRYQQLRRPLPGARALLEALKPYYRIGIVTNNRTAEQVDKLRHLGMHHLVDALITSEDVGVPKPNAHIFEAALAQLGAQPAEAVLVGDNWTADVVGALGAGIRPVWINRAGVGRPLAHVQELAGLLPLPAVWQTITGRFAVAGALAV